MGVASVNIAQHIEQCFALVVKGNVRHCARRIALGACERCARAVARAAASRINQRRVLLRGFPEDTGRSFSQYALEYVHLEIVRTYSTRNNAN